MADINIHRAHSLGLKGAKAAANKMAAKLEEKFQLTGDWEGNRFVFSRTGVDGSLGVSESDLTLEVRLGFLLKMMKGPIESAVHEQLEKVLSEGTTAAKAPPAKKPPAKKK